MTKKIVPFVGKDFPNTDMYKCPNCGFKLHLDNDLVARNVMSNNGKLSDYMFCYKCSQYFYVNKRMETK